MILRKPYAFLIKHFKLLHILLALPIIYLTYKTAVILSFLNGYIRSGYVTNETSIAATYINFFMILAIIVILGAAIAMFIMLQRKEKNTKFYVAIIGYYVIYAVMLFMCFGALDGIEFGVADATTVRTYRDIATIVFIPQFFYIVFCFIRGIGFDIKSFDFKKDLAELEIEEQDNEEFEVNIAFEDYKIKRYLRRYLRETIYYAKENSYILKWIGAIAGSALAVFLVITILINTQRYREAQTFTYSGFHITIKESMLTSYNYGGTLISKDKTFLVLKVNVANKSTAKNALDITAFRLIIDDNDPIYPIIDRGEHFIDFGMPYQGGEIKGGESHDYVLVYDVNPNSKKYTIQLVDSLKFEVGKISAKYKQTILKPVKINSSETLGTYSTKDHVYFGDSSLNATTLVVNNYAINDNYKYTYDFCYAANKCMTSSGFVAIDYNATGSSQTLLILDNLLDLDESSTFAQSIGSKTDLFAYLGRVRYEVDGVTKYSKLVNKTPREVKDKAVLQVASSIKDADYIELQLIVRNKVYIVVLKSDY